MTEPQKKGIGKSIVIALCVLVVIFAISTVYVYMTLQNQISALNIDKTNLQNQVSAFNTDKTNLQNQVSQLKADKIALSSQITDLENQTNQLTDIVNLKDSQYWANNTVVNQPANSYSVWNEPTNYAGYLTVNIVSSTTTNTYVEVYYSSCGVFYDNKISGIGSIPNTAVVFPVLPTTVESGVATPSVWVYVRVGNTNLLNGATETVTITYHY